MELPGTAWGDFSGLFAIIGVAVLAVLAIGLPLAAWLLFRGKRQALAELSAREIAVAGGVVIPPEWGNFRGAAEKYGRVKCDGQVYLTAEAVVYHPLVGGNHITIARSEIGRVSLEHSFLGNWSPLKPVLVLHLKDGNRVGFLVRDERAWLAHLQGGG